MDLRQAEVMQNLRRILPASSLEVVKGMVRASTEAFDLSRVSDKQCERARSVLDDIDLRIGRQRAPAEVVIDHRRPEGASRWERVISSRLKQSDPAEDPNLAGLMAERKAAEEELARCESIHRARASRWQAMRQVEAALLSYVNDLEDGAGPLKATAAKASDTRNAPTAAAIERKRADIVALKQDLSAVRTAPVPKSIRKQEARNLVAGLSKAGAPTIGRDRRLNVSFPSDLMSVTTIGVDPTGTNIAGVGQLRVPSTLAMMAWLYPDAMVAALERTIDALPGDDSAALDDDTRAEKQTDIKAQILSAERDEETLIRGAHAAGLDVLRRADADPRAILGVVGPDPIER
ncbi:Uncharacterized protein MLTONO_0385 [Mesorhizobium loti]|nr:Uncharacterized protein MLTONO_0385 [Mesorhizobium loti]